MMVSGVVALPAYSLWTRVLIGETKNEYGY